MKITTVKLAEDGGYVVNGTISIPKDSNNRHYNEVQDWVAEGNSPDPYLNPANNVSTISKLELKYQAKEEGLWTLVKQAIKSDAEIEEDFNLVSTLDIEHPSVVSIGVAMGKVGQDLQDFFNNAKGKGK